MLKYYTEYIDIILLLSIYKTYVMHSNYPVHNQMYNPIKHPFNNKSNFGLAVILKSFDSIQ